MIVPAHAEPRFGQTERLHLFRGDKPLVVVLTTIAVQSACRRVTRRGRTYFRPMLPDCAGSYLRPSLRVRRSRRPFRTGYPWLCGRMDRRRVVSVQRVRRARARSKPADRLRNSSVIGMVCCQFGSPVLRGFLTLGFCVGFIRHLLRCSTQAVECPCAAASTPALYPLTGQSASATGLPFI